MIGLYGAIALVTSGMVGGGLLILPSIMAVFGTWSIFGWALAAFMAYSIAMVFINLNKYFKGKNPVECIALTFGDNSAFLVSLGYFVAMCFSAAAVSLALGNYARPILQSVMPDYFSFISSASIGYFSIIALFIINLVSFGSANLILIILTVVKILFFGSISIAGVQNFGSYQYTFGPVTDIFKAASFAMFAFLGIEFAAISSGNIKDPEKNVVKATTWGLIFATLVFVGIHCAVLFTIPEAASSPTAVYDAVVLLFGKFGASAFSAVAVISCLSTLNGILVVCSNTIKTMSDKKWIDERFATATSQKFGWVGALIACLVILFVLLVPSLQKYSLHAANCFVGLLYLFSVLVDMKKTKIGVFNLLAGISGLLMLYYNANFITIVCVVSVFSLGFILKKRVV